MPRRWLGAITALALVGPALASSAHLFEPLRLAAILHPEGRFELILYTTRDLALITLRRSEAEQEDAERLQDVAVQLHSLRKNELEAALDRLRTYIEKAVRIRADGAILASTVDFPDSDLEAERSGSATSLLGSRARLTGRWPEGARELTVAVAPRFGEVVLSLRWEGDPGYELQRLSSGSDSVPFRLDERRPSPGRLGVAAQYLELGASHILPGGLDHVLFVLGLFLLSPRVKPLLWQITAFTLAHSLTLALSAYRVVSVPSAVVEPLISASIAFVAIENLATSKLNPWRPALVLGFGLLHGLGFAGALSHFGLPQNEFLGALLSFNLGIELGQLSVIAVAMLTVGWFRYRPWYRPAISMPASAAIAVVAVYWTLQRTLG